MASMLVVAVIALTVTPIFVVNAFRLLATDTFVRHEIDRGGFPPDRYGLTTTRAATPRADRPALDPPRQRGDRAPRAGHAAGRLDGVRLP